jgi:hypothetical protein
MRLLANRSLLLLGLLAGIVTASLSLSLRAAETGFSVTIDASHAQPRQIEDTTVTALQRDYGQAWRMMAKAMEENRPELLNGSFVGIAKDKLTQAINDQTSSGLRRRYIDRGHRVKVVFYSVDGSAIEMHDTARIEIQLLDGSKVVHQEQATLFYVALMSPAENSWKVRALQSVPGF